MRALLSIVIPDKTRDNIARLQIPLPGADWLKPESLSLPLFFLEDLHGNDLLDLGQELELFDAPPFELTLGRIDITKTGQVYLQFNIPDELILKLRNHLKVIKKQNAVSASKRLILGTIPDKLKNKFIEFSIGFNALFLTEYLVLWEDGKYYFEKGRFPFKRKMTGPLL